MPGNNVIRIGIGISREIEKRAKMEKRKEQRVTMGPANKASV